MQLLQHRHTYIARINRVIDHISAHLPDTLDLPTLAALSVALEVGFASAEVFTRGFKAHFGVTPSAWRCGAWRDWAERHETELRKIHQANRKQRQAAPLLFLKDRDIWPAGPVSIREGNTMQVEIRNVPAMGLAYMRQTGPYGDPGITQTWDRFGTWCASHGWTQPRRKMFGISQDDPSITAADKCRYDCCIEVDQAFQPKGEVGVQEFAGGRYPCGPFTGTGATIHDAWMHMYGQWLPQSG